MLWKFETIWIELTRVLSYGADWKHHFLPIVVTYLKPQICNTIVFSPHTDRNGCKLRSMNNPSPLPLPPIDGTIHATARNTARQTIQTSIEQIAATFESAQEQVEYFTIVRDWCSLNLANIETRKEQTQTA